MRNHNINLQQDSILEIEASVIKDTFTSVGIYPDDYDGFLSITGPAMIRKIGGDANSHEGVRTAFCAQREIIFESDYSVSIISDTTSAVSIGCWLIDGDF